MKRKLEQCGVDRQCLILIAQQLHISQRILLSTLCRYFRDVVMNEVIVKSNIIKLGNQTPYAELTTWYQRIERIQYDCEDSIAVPTSVRELIVFCNVLPSNLSSLTDLKKLDLYVTPDDLSSNALPTGLTHLYLPYYYEDPLPELPPTLRVLVLPKGGFYYNPLDRLPDSLEVLVVDSIVSVWHFDRMPRNLKWLTWGSSSFSGIFDRSAIRDSRIETLVFRQRVATFYRGWFPKTLKSLYVYGEFEDLPNVKVTILGVHDPLPEFKLS